MNQDAINMILDEEVTFYIDKENRTEVYVEYLNAEKVKCFESINSRFFEAFLGIRYHDLTGEATRPSFKQALNLRMDYAIYYKENPVTIHRRIAGNLSKGIVYYLADDLQSHVVVTADGCKIRKQSELKFLKSIEDSEQVRPESGGKYLDLILPKLNMSADDALLYAIYLIHGFCRDSNHFAAVISSAKGTGKSTLSRYTSELVAPCRTSITLQPNTEDDLKTILANNYVVAFDNTKTFSEAFSNILCPAITGGTATKRKLYTNGEQVVYKLHNMILINGIGVVPYKADLAERSLYFELKPIPSDKRRTDSEIWEEFERDKPRILGAIFNTLSHAMRILPTVKIEKLHRMAEAHKEMTAIALALGIKQEAFQRILDSNMQKLNETYAENNEFVSFVLKYMEKRGKVELAASDLYKDMYRFLCESVSGDKSFFPGNESRLSRKLNEERDALLHEGYQFERSPNSKNSYLKISRVPQRQMTKAQKEVAEARRKYLLDSASLDD